MDLNLKSVNPFSHTKFTSKYILLAQRKHKRFTDWLASTDSVNTIYMTG